MAPARPEQGRPPTKWQSLPAPATARGFLFPRAPCQSLSRRSRGPEFPRPGNKEGGPAHSFFVFSVRKFAAKFRRLLADVQPVKKGVRRFEPNAEPVGDLFLFLPLVGFDLVISRDHLGAPFAKPRDVKDASRCRIFSVRLKAPPEFVEPHQADFRVSQRLEMEQVFKLFFELIFDFFEL